MAADGRFFPLDLGDPHNCDRCARKRLRCEGGKPCDRCQDGDFSGKCTWFVDEHRKVEYDPDPSRRKVFEVRVGCCYECDNAIDVDSFERLDAGKQAEAEALRVNRDLEEQVEESVNRSRQRIAAFSSLNADPAVQRVRVPLMLSTPLRPEEVEFPCWSCKEQAQRRSGAVKCRQPNGDSGVRVWCSKAGRAAAEQQRQQEDANGEEVCQEPEIDEMRRSRQVAASG